MQLMMVMMMEAGDSMAVLNMEQGLGPNFCDIKRMNRITNRAEKPTALVCCSYRIKRFRLQGCVVFRDFALYLFSWFYAGGAPH
jgi:hypothetical protein